MNDHKPLRADETRRIITEHVYPPIPIRSFDWMACRDEECGPHGWGRTETEAIANLEEIESEEAA